MIRAILKLADGLSRRQDSCLLEGGGEGDKVPSLEKRRKFIHLLSHKQAFLSDPERKENIQLVYTEVEEYLGPVTPSFDDFVEVLGRLYINGFEICDDKMISYGWGVYLGPSIMDHSCQPTAAVSFSGRRLTVTALRTLDSLDDLYISYCDPNLPTNVRRAKLEENYFFQCGCSKCTHSHRGHLDQRRNRNKGKR